MRRRLLPAGLFSLAALTACGGAATVTSSPPAGFYSDQSAVDAQATLVVYAFQATAVTQATQQAQAQAAAATSAVVQATADARSIAEARATAEAAQATATAQAMALAATATADGLAAQATTQALVIDATRQSAAIVATAAAEQRAAAAEEQLVAAEMARLAIEQQARQTAVERARMFNRMLPWGIAAAAVAMLAVLAAVLWRLIAHSRPQKAGDVWVAWDNGRPYQINVTGTGGGDRALEAQRLQLPAGPAAAEGETVVLPQTVRGHAMFAGPTDAGKSTFMRAAAVNRERVIVIDPHSTGSDWPGAEQIVGAGRNYDEIGETLQWMRVMLTRRYEARADGVRDFDPITVIMDETPSIVSALGRDVNAIWAEWLREGRKVGLDLFLATQSTRVRTLGIQGEGDLLTNFSFAVALGPLALREYPALAEGMEYPAILHSRRGISRVRLPDGFCPPGPPASASANNNGRDGRGYPVILPVPADNNGDVSPELRREIIRLGQLGTSLSEIQRRTFPSYATSGGHAFAVIKDILQEAAILPTPAD